MNIEAAPTRVLRGSVSEAWGFSQALVFLPFLLVFSPCIAQKEASIWHFGYRAGLDFSGGAPRLISGAMDAFEGCAVLCSPEGELLFYTNGGGLGNVRPHGNRIGKIWNRRHEPMYTMEPDEGGSYHAAQSALILPRPASQSEYYLFTIDDSPSLSAGTNKGLSYFRIDMRLNAGLGGVVEANKPIHRPAAECLTAFPASDGQSYWLVTLDRLQSDFVVIPVTPQGIGTPISQGISMAGRRTDVLKASPDGRFLFAAGRLFSFDPVGGRLRFLSELPEFSGYTASFSPKSRYLYTLNNSGTEIIRYDLSKISAAGSGKTAVAGLSTLASGQMQIAPDGHLYFLDLKLAQLAREQVGLSVIRCPDEEKPEVAFSVFTFPYEPGVEATFGLPNFADFLFRRPVRSRDTLALCPGEMIELDAQCPGQVYRWSGGEQREWVSVSQAGTYQVVVTNSCGDTLAVRDFLVEALPQPSIEFTAVPFVCRDSPGILSAKPISGQTYRWSTGDTTASLRLAISGNYQLTVSTTCGALSESVFVPDGNCCETYIPNSFSPNDDGLNDYFAPFFGDCGEITDYHFAIYSRWGERLFETRDPASLGWQGDFRGKALGSGLYVWSLQYRQAVFGELKLRQETGTVLLLH